MPRSSPTELFKACPDALATFDRSWQCTYQNHTPHWILGLTVPSLPSTPLWTTYPEAVGSVRHQHYLMTSSVGHP
jgi:hypothetical protein